MEPVEASLGASGPRHLPTVDVLQPTAAAMSVLFCPSAAASTIRLRIANACAVVGRRAQRSSVSRSSSVSVISTRAPIATSIVVVDNGVRDHPREFLRTKDSDH